MIMNKIDTTNHTKYTLEFILSEADKISSGVKDTIKTSVNRSYVALAIYVSLGSYSFLKVVLEDHTFAIPLLGALVSGVVLYQNLTPSLFTFRGSLPEKLVTPYFEEFDGDDLEKEYLSVQIVNYNKATRDNLRLLESLAKRFNNSIKILLGFLVVFFLVFFYLHV